MARRPLRLLILLLCVIFGYSAGLLGSTKAQTAGSSLQPQAQNIPGSAFSSARSGIVGAPNGISPSAPNGSAETPPTAAPAPFTYLLLRWRDTAVDESLIALEVRASEDGQTWTIWGKVDENDDLLDPKDGPGIHWSSTIYTGPAKYWQLRVTLTPAPDGVAPVLNEIRVITVDARGTTSAGPATGAPNPAAPNAIISRPSFVSRAVWGGSEVLNNSVAPNWYPANHLVVHHTADSNSLVSGERSWADRVKAEWAFHTYPSGRGWGDIGYNWVIDPNGVIYEGRNGSSDPSRDSVGFHDTANYGSMGVVLLGTFQAGTGVPAITPTAAAQNALVNLLAWKANQRSIDPLASSFYYGCKISQYCAPYNSGAIVANIAGHRQVTPGHTSCPGDLAMNILNSIRTRVRDLLASNPAPTPTPTQPPPAQITRAELSNVQYVSTSVPAGGVVQVRFTVRNTGNVAIGTQEPPSGRVDDISQGYVYAENECFIGNAAQSYPAFPKTTGSLRVVLGGTEGGTSLGANCAGDNGGYPWRWGIGGTLQPGETRTVVGYVRFSNQSSNTRTVTLRPGLVGENVTYYASGGPTADISVVPDDRGPTMSSVDSNGQPLASVYQLNSAPDSLFQRSDDPASAREGDLIGTITWDGSGQNWGSGGPLGQSDHYIVDQARPFVAPVAGMYTFETTTDDGSWLWVDGDLVVSNPGLHSNTSVSSSKWLNAGVHALGVKYFEATGGAYARYSWLEAGSTVWSTIPVLQSLGAPQRGTIFGAGQQIAIVADDLGGLGTNRIEYFVDGSTIPQEQNGSILKLSLDDGDHWVWYRAVDNGGSWSANVPVLVRVDTVPPVTNLSASMQTSGVVMLNWTSSPDAIAFDIQSYDVTTGHWGDSQRPAGTFFAFFGQPGHGYQFRIRGWDGLNWESWEPLTPIQTVPPSARFQHIFLPRVGH